MAVAYLAEGATSFTSTSWSDSTGFADNATLVINKPFGPVTASLDQSGLTNGITYLKVIGTAVGTIGSESAYFKVDADSGSSPHILWAPRGGKIYYQPAGNSNVCTTFEASGLGEYVIGGGGTVTTLRHSKGVGTVGAGTIVTNAEFWGSSVVTIDYNATAITDLKVGGGNVIAKRVGTTINIFAGNLTIWAASGAITTVNQWGGNVNLRSSGTITTFNHYGGTFNARELEIATTITTANIYSNVNRKDWNEVDSLLTVSTKNYYGQPVAGGGTLAGT